MSGRQATIAIIPTTNGKYQDPPRLSLYIPFHANVKHDNNGRTGADTGEYHRHPKWTRASHWPALAGKFVAQNERDFSLLYKHFDPCFPTVMRLTVLALFIALPAVAHGAVCPQLAQSSLEFKGNCVEFGESCADRGCCDSLKCTYFSFLGMVCLMIPFCSDSCWVTELLCRDAYVSNAQNSIQVGKLDTGMGSGHRCAGFFRRRARCTHPPDNWSWCRMFALSPANHSTTSSQPR